jgi:hypothetical protein
VHGVQGSGDAVTHYIGHKKAVLVGMERSFRKSAFHFGGIFSSV